MHSKFSNTMKYLTGVFIFIFALGAVYWTSTAYLSKQEDEVVIQNFVECLTRSGSVIMESYPRKCRSTTDEVFFEKVPMPSGEMSMFRIENPKPGEVISSPLVATGTARGSWYSEGTFTVLLLDSLANTIARAPARAQGEWMTEDSVPFQATLIFNFSTSTKETVGEKGTLVFMKANPSGLSENDASVKIPVVFAGTKSTDSKKTTKPEIGA